MPPTTSQWRARLVLTLMSLGVGLSTAPVVGAHSRPLSDRSGAQTALVVGWIERVGGPPRPLRLRRIAGTVQLRDGSGHVVASASSSSRYGYHLRASAGRYRIVALGPHGEASSCQPQPVTLVAGHVTSKIVSFGCAKR